MQCFQCRGIGRGQICPRLLIPVNARSRGLYNLTKPVETMLIYILSMARSSSVNSRKFRKRDTMLL